jgi:hypothetical protein
LSAARGPFDCAQGLEPAETAPADAEIHDAPAEALRLPPGLVAARALLEPLPPKRGPKGLESAAGGGRFPTRSS